MFTFDGMQRFSVRLPFTNHCISSKMEVGLLTLTKGERLSYGKLLLIMKDGRWPFCSDKRRKAVFCYLFKYLKDGRSSFFHQKLMKYELQLYAKVFCKVTFHQSKKANFHLSWNLKLNRSPLVNTKSSYVQIRSPVNISWHLQINKRMKIILLFTFAFHQRWKLVC
jgi:hypothetical protein